MIKTLRSRIFRGIMIPLVVMCAVSAAVILLVYGIGTHTGYADAFLPHQVCIRNQGVIVAHVVSDLTIGLAYQVIAACLFYIVKHGRLMQYRWLIFAYGAFIISCGWTHFMDIMVLWLPAYRWQAAVKIMCALASTSVALIMPSITPAIIGWLNRGDSNGASIH